MPEEAVTSPICGLLSAFSRDGGPQRQPIPEVPIARVVRHREPTRARTEQRIDSGAQRWLARAVPVHDVRDIPLVPNGCIVCLRGVSRAATEQRIDSGFEVGRVLPSWFT